MSERGEHAIILCKNLNSRHSMELHRIRQATNILKKTPLHPQWFIFRNEGRALGEVASYMRGLTLDIGCAGQRLRPLLRSDCWYVGLDYLPMVSDRYGTQADIYGDGQRLPLATGVVDSIALLDVLEHLPEPRLCIAECARILRPGGILVVQVPFLYPIHDSPHDYQRWALSGLTRLLEDHGFEIRNVESHGQPAETAALLTAISLANGAWDLLINRGIKTLAVPFLIAMIPFTNLLGWLIGYLSPRTGFMPHGYRIIGGKRL